MKRFYLLLLLVFVLFISLTSVSYAYTLDDVFTYASQLVNTPTLTPYPARQDELYHDGYNYLLRFESQIRYRYNLTFSDANYFIVQYMQTNFQYGAQGIQARIIFYSSSPNIGHTSNIYSDGTYQRIWASGGTYLGYVVLDSYGSFDYYTGTSPTSGLTDLYPNAYTSTPYKGFYLFADNEDYLINPGYQHYCINGIEFPSQYNFVSYYTDEITFNDISGFCYKLPFSYNENYKKLGYIEGWEDLDKIYGYFSSVYAISGDDLFSQNVAEFKYTKQNGALSNKLIFNEITGDVLVATDVLYNKQANVLSLWGYIGDDYISIPLVDTDVDTAYYSYFYNTNVSNSGDNSPISNDYYQSLPPSLINFINNNDTTYDDVQQNNLDYILNDLFENSVSGEMFGGNLALQMGYSGDVLDSNYYSNLIYDFYKKILETIASDNTNSSITFNIRSRTFTLNASDFLVPNGTLKTFVTTFLTAGIIYLFYLQIHHIVLAISTLDLYTTIKSFDQKHSLFM